jgi:uncharacterized protein
VKTDLHSPLGQERPPRRQRLGWLTRTRIAAALIIVPVLGLSAYSTATSRFVGTPAPGDVSAIQVAENATQPPAPAAKPQDTAKGTAQGLPRADARSGARVEKTETDDGKVVTKFSPGSRDGSGPVIVSAQQVGQDPRMAALPNQDLIESSPYGDLPKVGDGGLRPVDQYARPWSGAYGNRIAIVVSGLGLSQTGTKHAIDRLPPEVTLAFASSGNSLQRWMQEARRSGHEILIQVPFEPLSYPANDLSRDMLMVGQSASENIEKLHRAMGQITNYTGVMNYLGSRFLADADALDPVMRDIASRGLLFLDDGSSARSLTGTFAKTLNMPYSVGDVLLDGDLNRAAIMGKLDELERIAQRKGSAVGVASAFDESIAAIAQWSKDAERRGIEIVGVSALATSSDQ